MLFHDQEAELFEQTAAEAVFLLPEHLPHGAGWVEVPVLSLLIRLGRPRTLVQIGMTNSALLAAASGAARAFNTETSCYGVRAAANTTSELAEQIQQDRWIESAFPSTRVLEVETAQAPALFPDRSIDLLHIVGPSDKGGQDQLEAWSPKLSERAVCLTAGGGFPPSLAVLRFSASAAAVFVGPVMDASLSRLLDTWNSQPAFRGLLRAACAQASALIPARLEARATSSSQRQVETIGAEPAASLDVPAPLQATPDTIKAPEAGRTWVTDPLAAQTRTGSMQVLIRALAGFSARNRSRRGS